MDHETIFPGEKARRVAAAFVRRYTDLCAANNISGAVASSLIGVSRARLSSLAKESRPDEAGPNMGVVTFFAVAKACRRIEQLRDEGHLPARASRGKVQHEVHQLLLGIGPARAEPPAEEQQALPLETDAVQDA